jgi:hypothetical protein
MRVENVALAALKNQSPDWRQRLFGQLFSTT